MLQKLAIIAVLGFVQINAQGEKINDIKLSNF
jgi:hypothetical protein